MSPAKIFLLGLSLHLWAVSTNGEVHSESSSRFGLGSRTCDLLTNKFAASSPWTAYPIIFEPIKRGRLTVWTGISNLPTSEFKCSISPNASTSVVMDLANFANKLEWTFYDMTKGLTHSGVSVNHCYDVKFLISMSNKQANSYLECNTVQAIEQLGCNDSDILMHTSCDDCSHSLIELINSQLRDLIKPRLNSQIKDNLYWHLTQLLGNQHFGGPISLKNNFN